MSLLDSAMEPCVLLDKHTVSDGYGGYIITWSQGAEFNAAIVLDTSIEARLAAAQGVKDVYTITTRKAMSLAFGDAFQRLSDGQTFRVTSDGTDKKTPPSATLDMRQVTAEKWSLPNG